MLPKQRLTKLSNVSSKIILIQNIVTKNIKNLNVVDSKSSKLSNQILSKHSRQQLNNKSSVSKQQTQKIQTLVSSLYPKLNEMQKQFEDEKSKGRKSKRDLDDQGLFDSYTAQRHLQNKMSMNNAQKELDQRLRNKLFQRSKKLSRNMPQSYLDAYKTIQNQQKLRKMLAFVNQIQYQKPNVSPEGIRYYSQLKQRPAILKYTKQKIKQRQLYLNLSKTNPPQIQNPMLKSLSARKHKKQVQNKQILTQKWQKDQYTKQIDNVLILQQQINQISKRLKKIYKKQKIKNMSDGQIQQIQKSKILKQQHKILQQLGQDEKKISFKNKYQLVNKFNSLLQEFGKSSYIRQQINAKIQSTINSHKTDFLKDRIRFKTIQ